MLHADGLNAYDHDINNPISETETTVDLHSTIALKKYFCSGLFGCLTIGLLSTAIKVCHN